MERHRSVSGFMLVYLAGGVEWRIDWAFITENPTKLWGTQSIFCSFCLAQFPKSYFAKGRIFNRIHGIHSKLRREPSNMIDSFLVVKSDFRSSGFHIWCRLERVAKWQSWIRKGKLLSIDAINVVIYSLIHVASIGNSARFDLPASSICDHDRRTSVSYVGFCVSNYWICTLLTSKRLLPCMDNFCSFYIPL